MEYNLLEGIEKRVELMQHLPPYWRHVEEMICLQKVLGNEIGRQIGISEEIAAQLIIDTATWGLSVWEKELGLPVRNSEESSRRRATIKAKLQGADVSTVLRIKMTAEMFVSGIVSIIEHNDQYYFTVKIESSEMPKLYELSKVISEIKPAHLGFRLDVEWTAQRIYIGMFERRYRRMTVEWEYYRGGERKILCYAGLHTMMSRNVEVPFGVPMRQEKKGKVVEAMYIKMCRRCKICSMER